eukprot:760648-Hanusia_phi.AAC.1
MGEMVPWGRTGAGRSAVCVGLKFPPATLPPLMLPPPHSPPPRMSYSPLLFSPPPTPPPTIHLVCWLLGADVITSGWEMAVLDKNDQVPLWPQVQFVLVELRGVS